MLLKIPLKQSCIASSTKFISLFHCKTSQKFLLSNIPSHLIFRCSTSGVQTRSGFHISNINDANNLISKLSDSEKKLVLEAIKGEKKADTALSENDITPEQYKHLIMFNLFPFIGFGILDNMIMILAGEYIEMKLGAMFTLSTMAAAALGNTISDVAGIGLSHYVELLVTKFGVKQPALTPEQSESAKVRRIVNTSRAVGLVVGCLIGMFPLLFFH
uniref:Transmembrane protein 65 n=1 Tax=Panagrolaimus sp. ES5 TaxID=591445 RepID=A0AC34GAF1_9BILA